jgi:hypothetical protein
VLDSARRGNADYRFRFADRVQQHFFHDGALTPENASARWDDVVDQIDGALIAESARWGDYRRDVAPSGDRTLYTQEEHWRPAVEELKTTYFPTRTAVVLNQMRAVNLYPSIDAPVFSQYGGDVAAGYSLTLDGEYPIFYTLDSSDPRLPGGEMNPAAIEYTGSIAVTESVRITARAKGGRGGWSALEAATFTVDGGSKLRITEIMYHPRSPAPGVPYVDNDFEYLEFQNTADRPIDLAGVQLSGGVEFTFPATPAMLLFPGEHVLLVQNQAAFETRYGETARIAGEFSGLLSNGGERLVLSDRFGGVILDFSYRDDWQPSTDGAGHSLVIVDAFLPSEAWSDSASWRASLQVDGSPGRADAPTLAGDTDLDGDVDLADLNNVRNHFGETGPGILGDSDRDGDVDLADLNDVRNHFGMIANSPLRATNATLPFFRVSAVDVLAAEQVTRIPARDASMLDLIWSQAWDLGDPRSERPRKKDARLK